MNDRPGLTAETRVVTFEGETQRDAVDSLATEEPLEIRISANGTSQSLGVTMRTPGNDFELAAGFLFSEGVLASALEVKSIDYCAADSSAQHYNAANVQLAATRLPPLEDFARRFAITSSCGICGRATVEALRSRAKPLEDPLRVATAIIAQLPERMREAQRVFAATGGLHAAALFDPHGSLVALREDVGRHNALDKLIGWAFLSARLPLRGHIVLVSGRASYELVQKAILAQIPILCAVSAPSSLAVELAREFNLTLAGFVRGARCNVYSAPERIRAA